MKNLPPLFLGLLLSLLILGCSGKNESGHGHSHEEDTAHEHSEATHTHAEDSMENTANNDAKSSFSKADTLMKTYKGIHLALYYDNESESFTGTIENTTEEQLCGITINASTGNDDKLGMTEPTNLESRQSSRVNIPARDTGFENWSAQIRMEPCSSQTHTHEDGQTHDDHDG